MDDAQQMTQSARRTATVAEVIAVSIRAFALIWLIISVVSGIAIFASNPALKEQSAASMLIGLVYALSYGLPYLILWFVAPWAGRLASGKVGQTEIILTLSARQLETVLLGLCGVWLVLMNVSMVLSIVLMWLEDARSRMNSVDLGMTEVAAMGWPTTMEQFRGVMLLIVGACMVVFASKLVAVLDRVRGQLAPASS